MPDDAYRQMVVTVRETRDRICPIREAYYVSQMDQGLASLREALSEYGVDVSDPAQIRAAIAGAEVYGRFLWMDTLVIDGVAARIAMGRLGLFADLDSEGR